METGSLKRTGTGWMVDDWTVGRENHLLWSVPAFVGAVVLTVHGARLALGSPGAAPSPEATAMLGAGLSLLAAVTAAHLRHGTFDGRRVAAWARGEAWEGLGASCGSGCAAMLLALCFLVAAVLQQTGLARIETATGVSVACFALGAAVLALAHARALGHALRPLAQTRPVVAPRATGTNVELRARVPCDAPTHRAPLSAKARAFSSVAWYGYRRQHVHISPGDDLDDAITANKDEHTETMPERLVLETEGGSVLVDAPQLRIQLRAVATRFTKKAARKQGTEHPAGRVFRDLCARSPGAASMNHFLVEESYLTPGEEVTIVGDLDVVVAARDADCDYRDLGTPLIRIGARGPDKPRLIAGSLRDVRRVLWRERVLLWAAGAVALIAGAAQVAALVWCWGTL